MIGKNMARKGYSLMEMMVVVGILALLASASVPVAELAFNASKEAELQEALDRMREAIALYRRDCRNAIVAQIGYDNLDKARFCDLCPKSLESLTSDREEVSITVVVNGTPKTVKFHHRMYLETIPTDPFVGRPCWLIHIASGPANVKAAYNFRESETKSYYKIDFEAGKNKADPLDHPDWEGVFDVGCVASNTVDADDYYTRRGFNVSVDGTLYEDW